MSDEFRRLLEDRAGSPLHSVLEAGLRDRPSRRQLAQAAHALGIGAAGLGAAQSAAAGAAAVRAVHASLFSSLVKWGAAGLLLGGAALWPMIRDSGPSASPQPRPASSGRTVTTPPVATQAMGFPTAAGSSGRATRIAQSVPPPPLNTAAPQRALRPALVAEEAPTGRFEPLGAAPSSAPRAAGGHELDAEVALLDAARSALKLSNPNLALTWLDRHAALEAPVLAAEATLLRVEALLVAGRSAEARSVVQGAGGAAPGSAYAHRLRKLVRVAPER